MQSYTLSVNPSLELIKKSNVARGRRVAIQSQMGWGRGLVILPAHEPLTIAHDIAVGNVNGVYDASLQRFLMQEFRCFKSISFIATSVRGFHESTGDVSLLHKKYLRYLSPDDAVKLDVQKLESVMKDMAPQDILLPSNIEIVLVASTGDVQSWERCSDVQKSHMDGQADKALDQCSVIVIDNRLAVRLQDWVVGASAENKTGVRGTRASGSAGWIRTG